VANVEIGGHDLPDGVHPVSESPGDGPGSGGHLGASANRARCPATPARSMVTGSNIVVEPGEPGPLEVRVLGEGITHRPSSPRPAPSSGKREERWAEIA
jgi:hypothetical protein